MSKKRTALAMRRRGAALFVGLLVMAMTLAATWPVMAEGAAGGAVSEAKIEKITRNCESIKENLIGVQHSDSRARVYLGRYYEAMLSSFIMPLNVWLVGHNKSNAGLVENQNSFAGARGDFVTRYIQYQKELEELVAMDCKTEPVKFYEKLVNVRKARAVVAEDVVKLRKLMDEQVKLVTKLKEGLS